VLIHDNRGGGRQQDRRGHPERHDRHARPVAVATLTILDDEQVMAFGAATYALTEGGAASMSIPILRAAPRRPATTVTCRTVPGGLGSPRRRTIALVNTTLTFAAGAIGRPSAVVPILKRPRSSTAPAP